MWSTTRLCWRWRLIRRRLRRPRSRKPWSRGCFRSFHVPIAMASWRRTAGAIGQKRKVEAGFKGVIDGRYGQQIMRHTFRHHPASRLRRVGGLGTPPPDICRAPPGSMPSRYANSPEPPGSGPFNRGGPVVVRDTRRNYFSYEKGVVSMNETINPFELKFQRSPDGLNANTRGKIVGTLLGRACGAERAGDENDNLWAIDGASVDRKS